MKFNNFVTPGRTLSVSVAVHEWDERMCTPKGSGTVDGQSAVSARLTLEQFNLAERDAALAENDQRRIAGLKAAFERLWTPSAVE